MCTRINCTTKIAPCDSRVGKMVINGSGQVDAVALLWSIAYENIDPKINHNALCYSIGWWCLVRRRGQNLSPANSNKLFISTSKIYVSEFLLSCSTCANVLVSRCHHRITAALGSVRKVLTVTPTVRRYSTHIPCVQYRTKESYYASCSGRCMN